MLVLKIIMMIIMINWSSWSSSSSCWSSWSSCWSSLSSCWSSRSSWPSRSSCWSPWSPWSWPWSGEEPRHEQAHEEAPGNGQLGILSTDMVAVVLQVKWFNLYDGVDDLDDNSNMVSLESSPLIWSLWFFRSDDDLIFMIVLMIKMVMIMVNIFKYKTRMVNIRHSHPTRDLGRTHFLRIPTFLQIGTTTFYTILK